MRRFWTHSEIEQLGALYPDHSNKEIGAILGRSLPAINGMGKNAGLSKSPEYLAKFARLQKGTAIGAEFRIKKGTPPPNKGLRRPGYSVGRGRMKETQFKKGQLNGVAAKKWQPVGTIMPDPDGYLRIKIRERTPGKEHGWNPNVWPAYHRHLWEKEHGPIPAGHVVVFKDRNKTNCTIENLELITLAENMRRNSIWELPPELAQTIQLAGALKRQIRRLSNGQK